MKNLVPCPNCKSENGKKLNRELIEVLAQRFFVRGTVFKGEYGSAPLIQFNKYNYRKTNIEAVEWLREDIKLIEESLEIGFFDYGPRLWMLGEVEPLKWLERPKKRHRIINRILTEYPVRFFSKEEFFYRLRKEPKNPSDFNEYDSPLKSGAGRLDSDKLSVMYGSQDIEVCVHECRVMADDELFIATLCPTRDLKLLDLTALIMEEDTTEFESLDIAVHMLFLAGAHSYNISRLIAVSAFKAGFDGLIYPSYFSLVRTGAMPFDTIYGISIRRFQQFADFAKSQIIPNIALFGRPIKEGIVSVKCVNRLVLNRIGYDIQFGPVLPYLTRN